MEELLAIIVALVSVAVLAAPVLFGDDDDELVDDRAASLEYAKESKYREIRDAELDHQSGKLGDSEWHELDNSLRAEAVALLKQSDQIAAEASSLGSEQSKTGETV